MTSSQTSPPNLSAVSSRTLGLPNIAFVGKAGSGKSTASDLLVELGYTKHSFAAPLKRVAQDIWGAEAATDRDKLQRLGVAVREIDADAWVNLLKRKLTGHTGAFGMVTMTSEAIVIDDLRFPNEWHMLKGEGFVIVRLRALRALRIDRLKANGKWQDEGQLEHSSETVLDGFRPDYNIENDSTRTDLYDALVDVVLKERARR